MRILVFSWRDPKHPLAGGAEQVMHEHMKGWIEAGHKVTLFSSRSPGSAKSEILDGVEIFRDGYQYLGVQWAGFLYYLKNKDKYDFAVDQFHGLPFFTPLYVRKPKLAVIQEVARKVWFLNPLQWPLNWIIGIIGYLGEPLLFIPYRWMHFMTGSQSAKENVSRFGIRKKNITVVPHGVVLPKFSAPPRREKIKTVVYLGVLSKDKGIEDAIKCFSILNTMGKFQFWVIGRPETETYGRKIVNLVESFGLKNKVKFWGFVSQEKKFKLLARGHVLLNPSVHEGWGLVNIEANIVGTPVVAYRNAGLVDSVRDKKSGILCKENTPEGLTEGILTFIRNKNAYKKFVGGSLEWGKRFSWKKSRKLSLSLIRYIVSEQVS